MPKLFLFMYRAYVYFVNFLFIECQVGPTRGLCFIYSKK